MEIKPVCNLPSLLREVTRWVTLRSKRISLRVSLSTAALSNPSDRKSDSICELANFPSIRSFLFFLFRWSTAVWRGKTDSFRSTSVQVRRNERSRWNRERAERGIENVCLDRRARLRRTWLFGLMLSTLRRRRRPIPRFSPCVHVVQVPREYWWAFKLN